MYAHSSSLLLSFPSSLPPSLSTPHTASIRYLTGETIAPEDDVWKWINVFGWGKRQGEGEEEPVAAAAAAAAAAVEEGEEEEEVEERDLDADEAEKVNKFLPFLLPSLPPSLPLCTIGSFVSPLRMNRRMA